MISGGIVCTAVTPTVFWAVIAVTAVIPCTPQAANALRSAWMPAPRPSPSRRSRARKEVVSR